MIPSPRRTSPLPREGSDDERREGFHLRDGGSRTDRADHGLGGVAPAPPGSGARRRRRRGGRGRGGRGGSGSGAGTADGVRPPEGTPARTSQPPPRPSSPRSIWTHSRERSSAARRPPHRRNNEEAVARRPRSWPVRRRDVLDRTSERDRRRPIGRARRRAGDRDGRRRGGCAAEAEVTQRTTTRRRRSRGGRGRGRAKPAGDGSEAGEAGEAGGGRAGARPPALDEGRVGQDDPEGRPSHRRRPTNRGGPSPIPSRRRRPPSPRSRTRPRPPRRPAPAAAAGPHDRASPARVDAGRAPRHRQADGDHPARRARSDRGARGARAGATT